MTRSSPNPLSKPSRGCSVAEERLRRWRLVLGGDEADGTEQELGAEDRAVDSALAAVYGEREGGLGKSAPVVARWLGELRAHFPSGVVAVVQQDAIDRLGIHRLLLEPEVLENVTPDVHLAATLMSLRDALPEASRQIARTVVGQVVRDIERRLSDRTRAAARGALDRSTRTSRPRHQEIDWDRTIRANLRHYQPEHRTVIPERLVGHGRRRRSLAAELILCLDQSGSMAASVVHAGVLGASLASLPTLQTRVIAFDTSIVDLTDELSDPVDVLFGIQLGGGTDIDQALGYCQTLVTHPQKTVLILITDLYEGGDQDSMLRRAASLLRSGVRLIVLLALADDGAPGYDHQLAAEVASLGAPVFACTPDAFPDMLAAALEGRDVGAWAADQGISVA
ncbi:VWA domain-containing protein [Solirubrobacter soli]|uniref:VWA domain-containing protein n=1 Tax=Solirubrobacter soli TaxID=363832 RepID=UPI00069E46E6